jgi:hypothetical protein
MLICLKSELCWRLRTVYDRQEVIDLLGFLQVSGLVKPRFGTYDSSGGDRSVLHQEYDDKKVFWFVGDAKHWYQV